MMKWISITPKNLSHFWRGTTKIFMVKDIVIKNSLGDVNTLTLTFEILLKNSFSSF